MEIIGFIVLVYFYITLTLTFIYQVKQDYKKASYFLTWAILMYLIIRDIVDTGV